MEDSILTTTKKTLNLAESYTAFDLDLIIFINSAFSTLNQLGIGPADGFTIEDKTKLWADLSLPDNWLGMVKTYIFLKAKLMFDPPGTSFVLDAIKKQIEEHEWRLSTFRDEMMSPPAVVEEPV